MFDDRIYVFTPQAAVIELPAGATPVDFAYTLHTDLGHRCRGARVDGDGAAEHAAASGQTVEINRRSKEGARRATGSTPSSATCRARAASAKVRAWFNAQAQRDTIARGREAVEKLLQREGRTSMKLDELAAQLGFRNADALFEVVGKDEFSLRNIESLLRPPEPARRRGDRAAPPASRARAAGRRAGGGRRVAADQPGALLPAGAADAIGGFVTRGKGVAIHRADCINFRQIAARSPERVIAVAWGEPQGERGRSIRSTWRSGERPPGLLRDITEVFAKEKMNVTGVKTQSIKDAHGGTTMMTFTVEVGDASTAGAGAGAGGARGGVRSARRR